MYAATPSRPADTLLIAASFFGYAGEIKAALEKRGRSVLWVEDRPATDTWTKLLVRIHPRLVARQTSRFFEQVLAQAKALPITRVLVIKGEALSISWLERLRRACPKAECTLYFWDSYRNMPRGSDRKLAWFDRAFSFDPQDVARDPRLKYRPLFFLERFTRLPPLAQDIDVLFLGTVHTDRFRVLKRLEAHLPADLRFERVLYYPSRGLFAIRRWIDPRMWGAHARDFVFEPIGAEEVMQLIARTRIAVDVERAVQAGFTMRTIEMLGAGKKLITTNACIQSADFYNPRNMAVLDRRHPRLDKAFLRLPYEPVPDAVLRRYSLSGWLDEVLPDA